MAFRRSSDNDDDDGSRQRTRLANERVDCPSSFVGASALSHFSPLTADGANTPEVCVVTRRRSLV